VKKCENELNRAISKEEVQMAKNHIKKCSTSLLIKEMQTKTTLIFTSLLLEWLPSRTQATNVGKEVGEKER
jgi:hypothetical protein